LNSAAEFIPSESETTVNTAAQAGWPNQVPSARTSVVASRSCPVGKAQATQPSGRISKASTTTRSVRAVTVLTKSVEVGGTYYNPKAQVSALEQLRSKLPASMRPSRSQPCGPGLREPGGSATSRSMN
jgi:hypothetical protein